MNPEYNLDLLAVERKVQPRTNPDFDHPSTGRGNHLATVFLKLALPHDQIEDR